MEDRQNAALFEVLDQRLAARQVWQQQVEHVIGLDAVGWGEGQAHILGGGPGGKFVCIGVPDALADGLDMRVGLELRQEEGCQEIGGQVAGADIHPGVFIYLAAEEAAAIGAFLSDDLGAFHILGVVDQQGAALAAGEVLGLVKALRCQAAEAAQGPALVLPQQAVGVIFHNGQAVAGGDLHDTVHFTAYPGVMHDDDGPGAGGDQALELGFVQVEGIGADIGEDRAGAAQHEGVDGGDEGKIGQDDFVAGLDIEQQGAHFQGVRAGTGQEGARGVQLFLQKLVTQAGKMPIAGNLSLLHGLRHVVEFFANQAGFVEGDMVHRRSGG